MSSPPPTDETLFAAALERPAKERAAFLDTACAGDAARRARIEGLLSAHDAAERDFMATAASGTPRLSEPAAGQTIGRYKLLQKLGEGGCGTVYMAEQEEPVRRRVALKVIKLGMDTKEVIARFSAEQQALALMDHANIARVFDAGATESGRPFFVMELVRGIPITRFCDEQNLPTAARLELFTQVCHAVQHAHQKGIIHRDIKPSNILVTLHDGTPVPKVIDFGIAKATQGRLTDATLFTAFEQFIGTPAYMSPEQAEMSGLDIDTRSDIYSLGVLLYELLTGRPPFDPKTLVAAGLDEIRRIIREVEPPRPSTRLNTLSDLDRATIAKQRSILPAQLSTLLRGDLDWVVMRCLEKDRTRRYETANAVALDVLRHLHDEPVVARPPSTVYRLAKAFRRHRLATAAAAALTLAITLGGAISVWQAVRATRAENVAEAQRQLAEQRLAAETIARAQAQSSQRIAESESLRSKEVARFMEDMLTAVRSSAARGRDTTLLRDLLEDTSRRIGRDLGSQPEVEATLRGILGRIYRSLGDHAKSLAMHEAQLALRRQHATANDPELALALEECAAAMLRVASAALSVASEKSIGIAENLLREALGLRRARPNEWRDIANCTQSLAECLVRLGRFDEADRLVRGLSGIVDLSTPELLAIAFVNYGALLDRAGRAADAERYFRDALQKLHEVAEEARAQPRLLSLENAIQINLASVIHGQGRYGESAQLARARIEVLRARHGDSHAALLPALDQLSRSLHSLDQKIEAAAVDEAAHVIRQKTLSTDRPLSVLTPAAPAMLGASLAPENDRAADFAAVAAAREQQGIRYEALRLTREANALNKAGKRPQAEPVFRAALAEWRKLMPRDISGETSALTDLAGNLSSSGNEAIELYREAVALLRANNEGVSVRAAVALSNLSRRLAGLRRFAEAVDAARDALAAQRALCTANPRLLPNLPSYLIEFAERLLDADRAAEAEGSLREAYQLRQSPPTPATLRHLAAAQLAACLLMQKKTSDAKPLLDAVAEFWTTSRSEFSRIELIFQQEPLRRIVEFYEQNESTAAAAWRERREWVRTTLNARPQSVGPAPAPAQK